jgi:hypothetical protein
MENIKEWLQNEYISKKRTCNDIAKELSKDPKTIWAWLKKYNIPTRPRGGHSSSGSFKKGTSLWIGKKHKQETKDKIRNARLKDGHVPYLKNGVHWLKNTNSENHPNYKGGLSPERQSFYCSMEWIDVVKKVWKRDNAICQNCGKCHNTEKNRGNFHIHHIVSFQIKELRSDLSNLVLLCKECHRWVHSKKNINKKFIKTI